MFRQKTKNTSLILVAVLIVAIIFFAGIGMTYAYFHSQKSADGKIAVGGVGAKWQNSTTLLTNSTVYQLTGTTELERGDANGTNMMKADGVTAGGDLRLQADANIGGQYVRVKFTALVDETDVSQYLTFRYVDTSTTYVFGSNTFWKAGGDGWYYYINSNSKNVMSANNYAILFNNIVLSGEYPTSLLGKTIDITFTYEAIQSANSPISTAWGASAVTALGLSN